MLYVLVVLFLLFIASIMYLYSQSLGISCSIPWLHLIVPKEIDEKLLLPNGKRKLYFSIGFQLLLGVIATLLMIPELWNPTVGQYLKPKSYRLFELVAFVVYFSYILSALNIRSRYANRSQVTLIKEY